MRHKPRTRNMMGLTLGICVGLAQAGCQSETSHEEVYLPKSRVDRVPVESTPIAQPETPAPLASVEPLKQDIREAGQAVDAGVRQAARTVETEVTQAIPMPASPPVPEAKSS